MKIYIDQIPDSGLELSECCAAAHLDLHRADIKFTEPINLTAQITKGINSISVAVKIEAMMLLNCSRCLEEFTAPFLRNCTLDFIIENEKVLDITDNLREEIIVNCPLKPLCRADCRGLCTSCGQNLNKIRCSCSPLH